MSEEKFPSGPWTGFYVYNGLGRRFRMDLTLTFVNGRVTGEGNDVVGPFVIAGNYEAQGGECYWTKTYVGAHDVFYRGFREGKGIWGTWEIEVFSRGGFHIWPLGEHEGEYEIEEVVEQLPTTTLAPSATIPSAESDAPAPALDLNLQATSCCFATSFGFLPPKP